MKTLLLVLCSLFLVSCSLESKIEPNVSSQKDQSFSTKVIEDMTQEYHQTFDLPSDTIFQKTLTEQEEFKKSKEIAISNLETEYLKISKIFPKFEGKITYLTVPESMNNL